MAVLLNVTVTAEGFDALLDSLEREMAEMGVVSPPDRAELQQEIVQAAKKHRKLVDFPLVRGLPPVPPEDGTIEWGGEFFCSGYRIDEKTGAIDYRQRTAEPAVEEGQLLARVLPPKDGVPGRNVLGGVVPVEKPKPARIRAGENVEGRIQEDTQAFYARKSGRVRFIQGALAVDRVYTISGNVGLETGHVRHPGALVILGDVQEGSIVEAQGNIEIKGSIEAADIRAGADLTVRGGSLGTKGRTIRIAGNLEAKFILDSNLEVEGDVIISREIVNSYIKTRGTVSVTGGRIVGGEIIALGGLVLDKAGSGAMVPTRLVAGYDYTLADQLAPIRAEITPLKKKLETLRTQAEPWLARKGSLRPAEERALAEIQKEIEDIEKPLAALNAQMQKIEDVSRDRMRPRILIKSRIYPETHLCIRFVNLHIFEPTAGPVQAMLKGDEVVLVPAGRR